MSITLLALTQGIVIGLLVSDYRKRRKDSQLVIKLSSDAADAASKLSDLHNKQIEQMKALHDKVLSHELTIKAYKPLDDNKVLKRF